MGVANFLKMERGAQAGAGSAGRDWDIRARLGPGSLGEVEGGEVRSWLL